MNIQEAFEKIKEENKTEKIKNIMKLFNEFQVRQIVFDENKVPISNFQFRALDRNIFICDSEGLEGIIIVIGNNVDYDTKSILVIDVNHQDMYFLKELNKWSKKYDFRVLVIKDFIETFNRKTLDLMRGFNDYFDEKDQLIPKNTYLIPKSDICFKFDSYENFYKDKLDFIQTHYRWEIQHQILEEKENQEVIDSISEKYRNDVDESDRILKLSLEKRTKKDKETLKSIREKYDITHYTGIDFHIERRRQKEIEKETEKIYCANQERIQEYIDSKIKLIDHDAIVSMNSIIFDRNRKDPAFKFTNQFQKNGVIPYGCLKHSQLDSYIESDNLIFEHNKAIIEQEETIRFSPSKSLTLSLKRGVYEFDYIDLMYREY